MVFLPQDSVNYMFFDDVMQVVSDEPTPLLTEMLSAHNPCTYILAPAKIVAQLVGAVQEVVTVTSTHSQHRLTSWEKSILLWFIFCKNIPNQLRDCTLLKYLDRRSSSVGLYISIICVTVTPLQIALESSEPVILCTQLTLEVL